MFEKITEVNSKWQRGRLQRFYMSQECLETEHGGEGKVVANSMKVGALQPCHTQHFEEAPFTSSLSADAYSVT